MPISIEDFIAGWIGGVCGLVVGHPLETIKVRQQAFGSSFVEAINRTYKYEKLRGFFKGILLPLMAVGPSNALLFGIYGNMFYYLEHRNQDPNFTHQVVLSHVFVAGVIGGLFQTIFICPVEMVKTVLQARTGGRGSWRKHYEVPFKGPADVIQGIIKVRGYKGLFTGLSPMLIRDVPTSGIYTLTYYMLMHQMFGECETPTFIKQTIAGGCAGFCSWILVFPLDVVKSRMQVDSPYKPAYKGMWDCFIKSYKKDGYQIFLKGLPAAIMRTFPVNAAIFIAYEAVLSLFPK